MNAFFAKDGRATFVDRCDIYGMADLERIGYKRVTRKEAEKIVRAGGTFLGEYAMVSRQKYYRCNADGAYYYRRNPSDGLWYLVRRSGHELDY